ncbi:hypothetical protein BV25DRAFT_1840672 [Artomyces pyxidatus]|uniref:Uncharacterized protein n=1 Tax=Artomyces pyxidatus TaxID=48021 RepID=A0ACB8SR03_9AGAM|nr:hypothetical protein BV25DRAFT_1840672 [Artomyces pyxidatus]
MRKAGFRPSAATPNRHPWGRPPPDLERILATEGAGVIKALSPRQQPLGHLSHRDCAPSWAYGRRSEGAGSKDFLCAMSFGLSLGAWREDVDPSKGVRCLSKPGAGGAQPHFPSPETNGDNGTGRRERREGQVGSGSQDGLKAYDGLAKSQAIVGSEARDLRRFSVAFTLPLRRLCT